MLIPSSLKASVSRSLRVAVNVLDLLCISAFLYFLQDSSCLGGPSKVLPGSVASFVDGNHGMILILITDDLLNAVMNGPPPPRLRLMISWLKRSSQPPNHLL